MLTGIDHIVIAVNDLEEATRAYRALVFRRSAASTSAPVSASCSRPHTLDFLAPEGGRGPLAEWLRARGPSPYAATLGRRLGAPEPLDPTLTQGAWLAYE
ncbi:MAG: hypothetical protein ACRELS_01710 [Candidatus Rokuibacteriota bacterium]